MSGLSGRSMNVLLHTYVT